MAKSAIERLVEAVGYPERVPAGAVSSTLRVDGMEIAAKEQEGRIRLEYVVTHDESLLPSLATYAAGRLLREDAALAWGDGAFIWQDADAGADARSLLRFFETFMDSCDWWRARVDALGGREGVPSSGPETFMIRP